RTSRPVRERAGTDGHLPELAIRYGAAGGSGKPSPGTRLVRQLRRPGGGSAAPAAAPRESTAAVVRRVLRPRRHPERPAADRCPVALPGPGKTSRGVGRTPPGEAGRAGRRPADAHPAARSPPRSATAP